VLAEAGIENVGRLERGVHGGGCGRVPLEWSYAEGMGQRGWGSECLLRYLDVVSQTGRHGRGALASGGGKDG
jgi:hypothetical protein